MVTTQYSFYIFNAHKNLPQNVYHLKCKLTFYDTIFIFTLRPFPSEIHYAEPVKSLEKTR